MNPYIDENGYLCFKYENKSFESGLGNYLKTFTGVTRKWTKRYKVNTNTGLFEEVTN